MSTSVDCVIDTQPMARQIDTVSGHLQGTTAAVVGMQAAVIQAENDAADQVCANVNKGFYTLIHSQISQKIAKLHSEVDSHVMKLNHLTKQLLGIRKRMERDYSMVTARYVKLFNGLNKNLELRVFNLDRPVVDFILKDAGKISNRSIQLTATVPVSQLESLSASQKIIASNLKYRGMDVIDTMAHFLADMKEQDELTDHILLARKSPGQQEPLMIPVIVSEAAFDQDGSRREIYVTDGISPKCQREISSAATACLPQMTWQEGPVSAEIRHEFTRILEASGLPERVKKTAEELFSAHSIQTLKNVGNELQS